MSKDELNQRLNKTYKMERSHAFITFPEDCNLSITFPNVFSPNDDGTNDLFSIEYLPENTEVLILNRWGNIVFSSTNYQNNWNGKDNSGKELLNGVYIYKFKTKVVKLAMDSYIWFDNSNKTCLRCLNTGVKIKC